MKKGQVTIILIIAIVLVCVLIVFFAFKNKISLKSDEINPDVSPIYNQLSNCIEQRAIDAIRLVGLQGGYVLLPENYLETEVSNIGYGGYEGRKTLPDLKRIEDEIENYLDTAIPYCINEDDFVGFEISQDLSKSKVIIKNENVKIDIGLALSIVKGEKTIELDEKYEEEIPIRLGFVHETAENIIIKQISEPDFIDLSYLSDFESNVVFIPVNDKSMIFIITDDKSAVEDIPYSFALAYRK